MRTIPTSGRLLTEPPKLHQAGERGKSTKRVYMWDSFVEMKKEDMMNLKDPQRLKMARLITKYFEKGTPSSIKLLFEHAATHSLCISYHNMQPPTAHAAYICMQPPI